jgi:hypothetical protein
MRFEIERPGRQRVVAVRAAHGEDARCLGRHREDDGIESEVDGGRGHAGQHSGVDDAAAACDAALAGSVPASGCRVCETSSASLRWRYSGAVTRIDASS